MWKGLTIFYLPNMKKKAALPTIRSSAAEYLTFVAATGNASQSIEMRYEDENIWLTQKMLAELYGVSVSAINQHIKRIFEDGELKETATIKKYLIVQNEGNRQVSREVEHYNLQMIANSAPEDILYVSKPSFNF